MATSHVVDAAESGEVEELLRYVCAEAQNGIITKMPQNRIPAGLRAWLIKKASTLKYPTLFKLFLVLFGIDVLVPDMIPFADEILLGLLTLMFGSIRNKQGPQNQTSESRSE